MSVDRSQPNLDALPSVDRLLNAESLQNIITTWGRASVQDAIREIQRLARKNGTSNQIDDVEAYYVKEIETWLSANRPRGYEAVFNLTGTVLHSNLGRSLISEEMYERVKPLVTRPASIEFDIAKGARGIREEVVCDRLCRLVQCEAAAVVNNNAAAVLLVLNTFARNRNVLVSRGELIEIGGSFRLPEIMEVAGCELVEVGTTNRTHLKDFERGLASKPALMLKVHPSNYRIDGFTQEVDVNDLSGLAKERSIPCVVDLGSGALVDTKKLNLPHEPMPQDALNQGADIVTFSGDKLLGGPQAGLLVGSKQLIDVVNANPMKRALRTSKLTLALLEETLKAYENPERMTANIPTLRLLQTTERELEHRAAAIHSTLAECLQEDVSIEIQPSEVEVGSGTMPGHAIPSVAVALRCKSSGETKALAASFRQLSPPVLGRLHKGSLMLDMRGAEPLDELLATLQTLK